LIILQSTHTKPTHNTHTHTHTQPDDIRNGQSEINLSLSNVGCVLVSGFV